MNNTAKMFTVQRGPRVSSFRIWKNLKTPHFQKSALSLRQRKDLTVRALAQRINRSVGFVSQIERGLSRPSVEDLHAISAALGVHSMYFLAAFHGQEPPVGLPARRGGAP